MHFEVRAAGLDAQGLEENWESSEFHPEDRCAIKNTDRRTN
jgi:hypothetical protein